MRKLFTLLILVFLWSTGMTQERTTLSISNVAPKNAQTVNPLAPMQVGGNIVNVTTQGSIPMNTSNILEKKVRKVSTKSLPETNLTPLSPLQGGENIATAFVLSGTLPITSSGTTAGYLNDYNENCPYTGSTAPDVVYAYTPPSNVIVDIDLCGSSYDTKVFVYENAATPGSPFACNDDFYTSSTDPCGQYVSKIVQASLIGGNTYYIVIDGYGGSDFGPYNLTITQYTPPPPCVWGVDIVAPPGSIAESETCGTDANGGCNMAAGTETWEPVPSTGGTISGTMWADLSSRDTDWFQLVVTQSSTVTLTANADQLIVFGYITGTFTPGSPTCAAVTGILPASNAGPCNQSLINMGVLNPGTYWFFVGMTVFTGFPCTNHYWINFNVVPEACPAPFSLVATDITNTSADLSWTAGGAETNWNVEVGLSGFTVNNGEYVFRNSGPENPLTATPLDPGTAYDFYVQSDCGGSLSVWSGPYTFTTTCSLTCPSGSIPESEVCGTATNDGCNMPTPAFQNVNAGDIICGTAWALGGSRDTDWFSITLTEPKQVILHANSEAPLLFGRLNYGTGTPGAPACPVTGFLNSAFADPCVPTTLNLGNLVAGTHWFFAGISVFEGYACGTEYSLEFEVNPPALVLPCGNVNLGLITPTTTPQNAAYPAGNSYFWSFNAVANATYSLGSCGAGEDTYIRVYDNAMLVVASNDDFGVLCPTETAGSLVYTPTVSGIYYVSVAHYSCSALVNAGNLAYFYVPAPACIAPTGLNVTSITTTGASLGWTSAATAWEYQIGLTGFVPAATGIATLSNPTVVSGLIAATSYDFYVRANCGGTYSTWTGPYTFSTACDAVSLPFAEDFTTQTLGAKPACWSTSGLGLNNWTTVATNNAGGAAAKELRLNWTPSFVGASRIASPVINTTGATSLDLSFNHFIDWYELTMDFSVKTTSNGGATWNTVWAITASGNVGPLTQNVTINNADVGSANFQIAFEFNANSFNLDYWYIDDISLIESPATKTLNLTGVILEGLYAGGGVMNQAQGDAGAQFGPGVADEITVELHDATTYATIVHSATVALSTTGTATVSNIPGSLNGNYYITIRHRNSIETTTANPVSFAGAIVNQSFALPANVYGGNLLYFIDGVYAIYGGDVNQDGVLDTSDMSDVDNDAANYVGGYVSTDADGSGGVDTGDMTIVDNNSSNYVGSILP